MIRLSPTTVSHSDETDEKSGVEGRALQTEAYRFLISRMTTTTTMTAIAAAANTNVVPMGPLCVVVVGADVVPVDVTLLVEVVSVVVLVVVSDVVVDVVVVVVDAATSNVKVARTATFPAPSTALIVTLSSPSLSKDTTTE